MGLDSACMRVDECVYGMGFQHGSATMWEEGAVQEVPCGLCM